MTIQIYSSAALRNRQREVKDAARKGIVHITENGNGTFVFCSEEVFEKALREAAQRALYEAQAREGIMAAKADIAAGRVCTSIDEAFAEAASRRAARG